MTTLNLMGHLSAAEWENIEREEHDSEYRDSVIAPIDVTAMIAFEDYCYKKGCRMDRGHRTRKALEAMPLDDLNGKRVLDVGCGTGKYAVLFALLGAHVEGFDISPVGVRKARALAKVNRVEERCRFSVQNASHIQYPDQSFDIVFLHEVLHHAIKYPHVREEILRILKPGGKAIIAESLAGNPVIELGRRITMRGKENKGDVILTLEDIHHFSSGFSHSRVEMMSLFFMSKRVFQDVLDLPGIRPLLFLTKKLDDAVLRVCPFLKRYCGECVVVLTK